MDKRQLFVIFIATACFFLFGQKAKAADADILINEIYYNANAAHGSEPKDEWVELTNSGTTSINLKNWQIKDNHTIRLISANDYWLKPNEFVLISETIDTWSYWPGADSARAIALGALIGNGLSNSGDCLILIDSLGTTIDTISWGSNKSYADLPATPDGHSLSRQSNLQHNFVSTETVTPGQTNSFPAQTVTTNEDGLISIALAKTNPNGQKVKIQGVVTVPPYLLSGHYFYIEDHSGGIQVYAYDKGLPNIASGQIVTVLGELSESNAERRVKITSFNDLVTGEMSEVKPDFFAVDQIGESTEGAYVTTCDLIKETDTSWYSMENNPTLRIYFDSDLPWKKPKAKSGDTACVRGIISQYRDNYRLLPILATDVTIKAVASLATAGTTTLLPATGTNSLVPLIIDIIASILWIFTVTIKKKRQKLRPIF